MQVPLLQLPEGVTDKVYIKFAVADFEMVKMADLKLSKLAIALKFEMIEYKLVAADDLKMFVSVYKTREFDEENYLGEVEIAM